MSVGSASRGTGRSNRLGCSLSFLETLDALFAARFSRPALEACLDTLDADPTHYTSISTVDDLDAWLDNCRVEVA